MPGRAGLFGVGALIGGFSGLAGVGGAMISVPFMTMWGVPFRSAIGTSAAIGFVVAVSGTAGYVAAGLTVPELPRLDPGLRVPSRAPGHLGDERAHGARGARLAHRLPVAILKKAFAVFLLALAVKLITAL